MWWNKKKKEPVYHPAFEKDWTGSKHKLKYRHPHELNGALRELLDEFGMNLKQVRVRDEPPPRLTFDIVVYTRDEETKSAP